MAYNSAMTFVLISSSRAIVYAPPSPHRMPANSGHLSVADAGSALKHAYPVERAVIAADAVAMSLASAHDRVTVPLAKAAASFVRHEEKGGKGAWSLFGYARLDDHARERFGRCGRSLRDLAALGDAMTRLPQLERALRADDGGRPLDRSAAVLICHVALPDTVDDWIDRARNSTVRELKAAIRAMRRDTHEHGRTPGDNSTQGEGEMHGSRRPPGIVATPDDDDTHGSRCPPGIDATPGDDDTRPRRLVKFLVPTPVMAMFDEALELFRAVEGCEASVTSFVEALVAEGMTGPAPADWEVESSPLTAAESRDAIERAHERSTNRWRLLPQPQRGDWALQAAGASLREFEALCARAGTGDSIELDFQIRELHRLENEMERRLADLLATMADQGAWARLRFDGSGHYAEERLRISRTVAVDRIRAARGLRRLGVVRRAYEAGEIALEPTLHIIRLLRDTVPDARTQAAWVERAREATVKRMRDEMREIQRRRLTRAESEVSVMSVTNEARIDASRDDTLLLAGPLDHSPLYDPSPLNAPLTDAAWRASLWREAGMARQRVERLGQLVVTTPVPDVFLRLRLPDDVASALLAAIESRRSHLSREAADNMTSSASVAVSVAKEFDDRCRRTPSWVGLMSLLEEFVQTWDPPAARVRRASDAVYARAGWRCSAPGCTSRRNLEDHHLVHRSAGGGNELSNRECLCRFHHQRGEHGGLARCRGLAPLEVTWRLGRDRAATWWRNERACDTVRNAD